MALRCHRSTLVEALGAIGELAHAQVNQAVGGSAVPAQDRGMTIHSTAGGDEGEVGNAAQVQQGPPALRAPQQCRIGPRYERCSLSP